MISTRTLCLIFLLIVLFANHAHAFGAGNIASISRIEGHNWRHGDIEDMLKTIACIKGHKWTSMNIKRVYFGNWLRDYSQALDAGTLKGTNAATIRILVWILSFMSFGYATAEFEVTDERLGVYRPEEHIDNPKDYADNQDARQYDPRLRPPVMPEELAIDPRTGMKNYIANESGGWATSLGYIRFSFARSIHFGRVYTNGAAGTGGKENDLCEALRCLGQGLHCLEDFGAHTNYVELALREMGFHNVFPHVGTAAQINIAGKSAYPLVTGTFGGVDFLHSVLGEANDHVTQSEVEEMNKALGDAAGQSKGAGTNAEQQVAGLTSLLSKLPNTDGLCREAVELQRASDAQAVQNAHGADYDAYGSARLDTAGGQYFAPPPKLDAQATIARIYPILEFRDKVVRAISSMIAMIPGLESLVEKIQESVTLFIMALLAPFIQPLIKVASQQLKLGSSTVIDSSGRHQFEPWTDPHCTDPTHSLLSKDHFSNILNPPAGSVACAILEYCAPRVLFAWQNPGVPLDQVLNDIAQVFHHPAARNHHSEIQQTMFTTVERWVQTQPQRGANLNNLLSSESVKAGKNHIGDHNPHLHGAGHGHGAGTGQAGSGHGAAGLDSKIFGLGSHSKVSGSPFSMLSGVLSGGGIGGGRRELDDAALAAEVGSLVQQAPPLPPQGYPADYTPLDATTYSTAYSQGYADQPADGAGGYAHPPPQFYPQQQPLGYGYGYAAPEGAYQQQQPQQQPPQEGYGQGYGQGGPGYGRY